MPIFWVSRGFSYWNNQYLMPRNALTFFFSQQHKKFSSQNILHTEYCSKMLLRPSKYRCDPVVQLNINIFCIIWQKTQAIYTKKESCCRKEQKFLKNHIPSNIIWQWLPLDFLWIIKKKNLKTQKLLFTFYPTRQTRQLGKLFQACQGYPQQI